MKQLQFLFFIFLPFLSFAQDWEVYLNPDSKAALFADLKKTTNGDYLLLSKHKSTESKTVLTRIHETGNILWEQIMTDSSAWEGVSCLELSNGNIALLYRLNTFAESALFLRLLDAQGIVMEDVNLSENSCDTSPYEAFHLFEMENGELFYGLTYEEYFCYSRITLDGTAVYSEERGPWEMINPDSVFYNVEDSYIDQKMYSHQGQLFFSGVAADAYDYDPMIGYLTNPYAFVASINFADGSLNRDTEKNRPGESKLGLIDFLPNNQLRLFGRTEISTIDEGFSLLEKHSYKSNPNTFYRFEGLTFLENHYALLPKGWPINSSDKQDLEMYVFDQQGNNFMEESISRDSLIFSFQKALPISDFQMLLAGDYYNTNTNTLGAFLLKINLNDFFTSTSVQGKIYEDLNGNCLQDAGEVPLVNWRVNVLEDESRFTFTDAEGAYVLDLLPGDYTLQAQLADPNWGSCEGAISISLTAFDTLQQNFLFQDTCANISTSFELDSRCGPGATQAVLTTTGPAMNYEYIWQDTAFTGGQVDGLFYGCYPLTISDGNCQYEDTLVNNKLNQWVPTARAEWKEELNDMTHFFIDAQDHIITLSRNAIASAGKDIAIVKLSTIGDTLWQTSFGGSGNDSGLSIMEAPDGMIWAWGQIGKNDGDFSHIEEGIDRVVIKLSSDGQLIFIKPFFYKGFSRPEQIVFRADGGFFHVFTSDFIDSGTYGKRDVRVQRFSADVEELWLKNYGGSEYDGLTSAVLSKDDRLTILARTNSEDYDLVDPLLNGDQGSIWLFQLDDDGAFIWQKLLGHSTLSSASNLLASEDGSFLISGKAQRSFSEINPWVTISQSNGYILRVSATGEELNIATKSPLDVHRNPEIRKLQADGSFWVRLENESLFLYNENLEAIKGFSYPGSFGDVQLLSSGDAVLLNNIDNYTQELVLLQANFFAGEDLLKDTFICAKEDLLIDLTGKLCNGCIPDWGGGDSSQLKAFSITADTTIYLGFLTEDACKGFDPIHVKVSILNGNILVVNPPHCNSEDGRLSVAVSNNSGQDLSYLWSTGETDQSIDSLGIGQYSVSLTDGICTDTDEFDLEIGYAREESFRRFLETFNDSLCRRNRMIYDVAWTMDGGFLVLENIGDNFLTKFDSLNQEVFQVSVPGEVWSTNNTLSTNSILETEQHYYLLKNTKLHQYTKAGVLLQSIDFDLYLDGFYCHKILQNAEEEFYLIGSAEHTPADSLPTLFQLNELGTIVKVDKDFNLIWKKQYGGEKDDQFLDGELTSAGDLLLTGFTASAKSDLSFNHGGKDAWLVKLNNAGDLLFSRTFGSSEDDKIARLTISEDRIFALIDQGAMDGSFAEEEPGVYLCALSAEHGFPLWKTFIKQGQSSSVYEGLDLEIVLGKEIYVATGEYLESLELTAYDLSGKELNITSDLVRLGAYGGMSFNEKGDLISGQGRHFTNGGCTDLSTSYLLRFNYVTPPGENLFSDSLFLCEGDSYVLDASRGAATYLWSTGATTPDIEVDTEGSYWVEVSVSPQCIYTDTFELVLSPNTFLDPGIPDTLFDCGSVFLDIQNSNAEISWSHGLLGSRAEINQPGAYQFLIKDSLGCSLLDSFYFDNAGDLDLDTQIYPESCEGTQDARVVLAGQNGTAPYQYAFYRAPNLSPFPGDSISNLSAGSYWVEVRDDENCLLDRLLEVGIAPPMQSSYRVAQTLDSLETYLYIDIIGGTPPFEVRWSFGNPFVFFQDSIAITESGIYYAVKVTDANGCVHFPSDSINIVLTGLAESAPQWPIRVYPNPTTGELFVERAVPFGKDLEMAVFDVFGRQQEGRILNGAVAGGETKLRLDMGGLAAGAYWLRILENGTGGVFRVVVLE